MRSLALVLLIAACGAPHRATLPPGATPAHDLHDPAAAIHAASRGTLASPRPPGEPSACGDRVACHDPRVVDLDIIRISARETSPGGDREVTAVASADLFKAATTAAKAGRQREAIDRYRELVSQFPESQFAPLALFNTAAIYDKQADLTATIATLRELVASYPKARESIDGHLYIAALQADHQQWPAAAATLTDVLARTGLTLADRVEAFARKGYVELEQHQYADADASLAAAISAWRAAPRIDDPYYIAMAHYYRGELLHRKFAEAPVRTGDDDMVTDLDAKRALAGQAYDRWRDSLSFKQAYWATASGYQMSQIFMELWEAHVKAPYPHRIDVATRPTYVADVHSRVRVDLEKALEGHRMNVELARAYGVETEWSRGSAQQAVAIVALLAKDAAGSYVSPEPVPEAGPAAAAAPAGAASTGAAPGTK